MFHLTLGCPQTRVSMTECGTSKFKESILQKNKGKCSDERKRFLVKIWETKTVRKEGAVQSFMDWKLERCNYVQLVDLLMDHLGRITCANIKMKCKDYTVGTSK